MIYFRTRKYHSEINCSFLVKDGQKFDNLDGFVIGDSVTIIFDIPKNIEDAINKNLSASSGVRIYSDFREKYVSIPFNVVDRQYGLSWKDKGILQTLSTSVYLEAKTGYWEDVFLWVCCNQIPRWASD